MSRRILSQKRIRARFKLRKLGAILDGPSKKFKRELRNVLELVGRK